MADAMVVGGNFVAPGEDAYLLALEAFVASFRLDHERARDRAMTALRLADPEDVEAVVLASAVRALASAGTGIQGDWRAMAPGETPTGDPLADGEPLLDRLPAGDTGLFARYAFAEAALACARVGLALRTAPRSATHFLAHQGRRHAFATVIEVLASRTAAFAGQIEVARDLLPVEGDEPGRVRLLADAARALMLGNSGNRAATRELVRRVQALLPEGLDRIDLGAALLCSYGLLGTGDIRGALRLAVRFDWDTSMVIDRALVYETLVHGAVLADDLGAAEAWLSRIEEFAGDPIADSALARSRSRVALLAGRKDEAIEHADRAIVMADREGRVMEAAESRVCAARARIAAGRRADAAHLLEPAALDADRQGFHALRRAADRVLRRTGRRIRPAPGSVSAGLSARERDVLALLMDGSENLEIARLLGLSEHTVRGHVSRILAAYGLPTRVALIAHARWRDAPPDPATWSDLTPRQREVVRLAVTGSGAAEMAAQLGISERTVEKHLADVRDRWGVTTRIQLVVRAASQ